MGNISSVSNNVVSDIIPTLIHALGGTIVLIYNGRLVVINPKVGAKLGVGLSGPTRVNTSLIIKSITIVGGCPLPTILFSVNATAATSIVSGGNTRLNNTVVYNIGATVGSLTDNATRLPRVSVSTPSGVVNTGAVSTVGYKSIVNATTVVRNVISHFRRRLNRGTAIILANKLTGTVSGTLGVRTIISRGLLLSNLGVVCGGGGGWVGSVCGGFVFLRVSTVHFGTHYHFLVCLAVVGCTYGGHFPIQYIGFLAGITGLWVM